jgi:hypothetical protein
MSLTGKRLLFVSLLTVFFGAAYALQYQWLTDEEGAPWGVQRSFPQFYHGDTLDGNVHSNGQFAIFGDPVFYAVVSTCEDDFWRGTGYNPQFLGPPPRFDAPYVSLGLGTGLLRTASMNQGHYFADTTRQTKLVLDHDVVRVYRWPLGTPFDSTDRVDYSLEAGDNYFYFVCPITISGVVEGRLVVGTARRAGIADNILYGDADSLTGRTPASSSNYFALASAGEIKILNTVANGRENSGGLGLSQTNSDSTSVVLCGAYYAYGERFTFENQNDPDSGYVCTCQPDERGTIYLYGGIVQRRAGYIHRSTRQSTGYLHAYRFDPRLMSWDDLLAPRTSVRGESTDTLRYLNVAVGATVWDTAYVYTDEILNFAGAYATYPWYSPGGLPATGDSFAIPCRFTPPHAGHYEGTLTVHVSGYEHVIVLIGETESSAGAAPAVPHDMTLAAFPNPFNSVVTLRYTLASATPTALTILDLSGREVRRFNVRVTPGAHDVTWDARAAASGLYFARLEAGTAMMTAKVLLLK